MIVRADEEHELYDLKIDPEELPNVFDTPRAHLHDEYRHFPSFDTEIITLDKQMVAYAVRVDDPLEHELADRILRQKRAADT